MRKSENATLTRGRSALVNGMNQTSHTVCPVKRRERTTECVGEQCHDTAALRHSSRPSSCFKSNNSCQKWSSLSDIQILQTLVN